MRIEKIDQFLPLWIFLQFHATGNIFARFCNRLFALPVALCCIVFKNVTMKGAFINDELVGLLIYNQEYKKVNYLFVKEEHRGKGIGSDLIRSSNCDCVFICKSARDFWIKQGFKRKISDRIYLKEGLKCVCNK